MSKRNRIPTALSIEGIHVDESDLKKDKKLNEKKDSKKEISISTAKDPITTLKENENEEFNNVKDTNNDKDESKNEKNVKNEKDDSKSTSVKLVRKIIQLKPHDANDLSKLTRNIEKLILSSKNWTIVGRCTLKSTTIKYAKNKNEKGELKFGFIKDLSNEVKIIAYGEELMRKLDILEFNEIFSISNGELIAAKDTYKTLNRLIKQRTRFRTHSVRS